MSSYTRPNPTRTVTAIFWLVAIFNFHTIVSGIEVQMTSVTMDQANPNPSVWHTRQVQIGHGETCLPEYLTRLLIPWYSSTFDVESPRPKMHVRAYKMRR